MNYGLIGQWVTSLGFLGVLAFAIYEIAATLIQNRRRQKIQSTEGLKRMVDEFTCRYGQRFEDPDDRVRRQA